MVAVVLFSKMSYIYDTIHGIYSNIVTGRSVAGESSLSTTIFHI